ncbi:MAG: PAS domain-containing protein [Rubrivivax sp.]|nr:PAS domain-containing protein [Pyrinomonadaceae bacterium]
MSQTRIPTSQDAPEIDFATLDLLPYGIIVTNEQGTILYYNTREEQIALRSREDVLGKNFFADVAPCTQVKEFHGRFKETMEGKGHVANFHFTFPFPDQPREVEISLTSFENKGELLCLISVGDVTEQKEVREQILRAERLREVGEVAAGVAHNFNNLLTVIGGNAEILLKRLPEDDPNRQRVEAIRRASRDGEAMVKRVNSVARQQPETQADAEMVDLNALVKDSAIFVEDYVRAAREERGADVSLELSLADAPAQVRASASELREVFVNLLRNAVDALGGGGRIGAKTGAGAGGHSVEITDTGQGMSAEVLSKIFRPLFTTKGERGTGMGLATCYAIVRRHGGEIEVKSTEGKGTTFTVRLPAA